MERRRSTAPRLLLRVHSAENLQHVSSNGAYCKVFVGPADKSQGRLSRASGRVSFKRFLGDSMGGSNSISGVDAPGEDTARDSVLDARLATTPPRIVKTKAQRDADGRTEWKEKYEIPLVDPSREVLSIRIKTVRMVRAVVVGACLLTLGDLVVDKSEDRWLNLFDSVKRPVGRLRVQLRIVPGASSMTRASSGSGSGPSVAATDARMSSSSSLSRSMLMVSSSSTSSLSSLSSSFVSRSRRGNGDERLSDTRLTDTRLTMPMEQAPPEQGSLRTAAHRDSMNHATARRSDTGLDARVSASTATTDSISSAFSGSYGDNNAYHMPAQSYPYRGSGGVGSVSTSISSDASGLAECEPPPRALTRTTSSPASRRRPLANLFRGSTHSSRDSAGATISTQGPMTPDEFGTDNSKNILPTETPSPVVHHERNSNPVERITERMTTSSSDTALSNQQRRSAPLQYHSGTNSFHGHSSFGSTRESKRIMLRKDHDKDDRSPRTTNTTTVSSEDDEDGVDDTIEFDFDTGEVRRSSRFAKSSASLPHRGYSIGLTSRMSSSVAYVDTSSDDEADSDEENQPEDDEMDPDRGVEFPRVHLRNTITKLLGRQSVNVVMDEEEEDDEDAISMDEEVPMLDFGEVIMMDDIDCADDDARSSTVVS